MPNWCENFLTVAGSVEELNEFARYVESDEMFFDFEEIIPEPPMKDIPYTLIHGGKTYHKTKSIEWDFGEYGKLDWYDWRCMFWGTKWNLGEYLRKDFINGDLVYSFDTAWAPPTGIIRELVRVFDNLIIKCEFAEPGMCFFGECGGIYGAYYEWDAELTSKTHPEYWTYACDECGEDFVQDGRVCPYCGYDENADEVST